MTSHDAAISAAGVSIGSGLFGYFASILQWFTAQNLSNIASVGGVVVGAAIIVYQRVSAARRQERQEAMSGESAEIKILMDRNHVLLEEIVKLNKKIVEVSSAQPHGCPVSRELVKQLHESGKTVAIKDDQQCHESESSSQKSR